MPRGRQRSPRFGGWAWRADHTDQNSALLPLAHREADADADAAHQAAFGFLPLVGLALDVLRGGEVEVSAGAGHQLTCWA